MLTSKIEPQLGCDFASCTLFNSHEACRTVYGTAKPTWFIQIVSIVGLCRFGLRRSAQSGRPHYVVS